MSETVKTDEDPSNWSDIFGFKCLKKQYDNDLQIMWAKTHGAS